VLEEKELKKKLKEFGSNYQKEHSNNVMDFKTSKNLAAGNGFNIASYGTIWNKDRAQVCVSGSIMEPIVNSVCFKFNESPFDFIPKMQEGSVLPYKMDFAELKFQLGSCLRDAVQDGLSYLLVFKKGEEIKFSRLNNFNVIFGDCDYSDGEDVEEVVYVDKRDTGKKQRKTEMSVTFDTVLNLTATEIPVVTYWYRKDGKVCTAKLEGDTVVEHRTQEISKIPIVRIYGKEVPSGSFKKTWRGVYYLVKDILRTMDFEQSLIQERIATAPNHLYWIAEESLSNPEQLSKLNDFPVAYKTYKATNPTNPAANLPPPTPNDLSTNISDLVQSFQAHKELVYQTLGSIAGETPGNETAEAVLMRRENKDTAVNEMIKNLLDSSHQIAEVIKNFTGVEVSVTSDIFDKAKQNDELQKIIALTQFMNGNPHAYSVTPVLIKKLDIDEQSKKVMLALLEQEKQGNEQSNMELEMLKIENQQLRANQEAQIVTAQINSQTTITKANIDAQIKAEELKFKYIELQQQGEAEGIKLAQDAQKIADDYEKDVAKIKLDGITNAIADTIHSVV